MGWLGAKEPTSAESPIPHLPQGSPMLKDERAHAETQADVKQLFLQAEEGVPDILALSKLLLEQQT